MYFNSCQLLIFEVVSPKGIVSPVFYKMFTSDFKEKKNGEVILHEKKYEDVIELLMLIYPNFEKKINGKKLKLKLFLNHFI